MNKELIALKEKLDRKKQELDATRGRLDQLLEQLESEFEISTIEEAEALLLKLTKQTNNAERKLETDIEAFEQDFSELLED